MFGLQRNVGYLYSNVNFQVSFYSLTRVLKTKNIYAANHGSLQLTRRQNTNKQKPSLPECEDKWTISNQGGQLCINLVSPIDLKIVILRMSIMEVGFESLLSFLTVCASGARSIAS